MSQTIQPAPVRKSLTVRAKPETAFRVFTENFDTWWPRARSVGKSELKQAVLEPRLSGRWYEIGVDGVESPWGEVLAWDPPAHLLLAWRINAQFQYDPELLSEVEVRFTALEDGQTRVDLEHRGFERMGAGGDMVRERIGGPNGWGMILGLFKDLAEA